MSITKVRRIDKIITAATTKVITTNRVIIIGVATAIKTITIMASTTINAKATLLVKYIVVTTVTAIFVVIEILGSRNSCPAVVE